MRQTYPIIVVFKYTNFELNLTIKVEFKRGDCIQTYKWNYLKT